LRGQATQNGLRRPAESAARNYRKDGAGRLYGGRELVRGRVAAAMLRFQSHPEVYRRQEMKSATKSLVLGMVLVAVVLTVGLVYGDEGPWWDTAWGYRAQLTVTNNSGTDTIPVQYSVSRTLDTAALIGAGQMLSTCNDLRVISFDGVSNTEIARIVQSCGTDHTTVWFATQRTIPPAGQDNNYCIYYGNPSAGAPPATGTVFLFYEDWEQGTSHWTSAGGLDGGNTGTMGQSVIASEEWVSPGHSQEFPVKRAGGDAFRDTAGLNFTYPLEGNGGIFREDENAKLSRFWGSFQLAARHA